MSASARASDPTVSAWVAANAGAGKTYTLANRVTRLLLADARPQRILCLTFTKAAAAEMQGRLFEQLGKWSMLPDADLHGAIESIGASDNKDLAKARRLFAQALETPGGLKVLTIHAFCQIVLSRFPIEAGVPPGFGVLDDNSARTLIAEARIGVLDRAGRGQARLRDAIDLLVRESGEEMLNRILGAALGNDRRKMDRFFAGLNGEAFEDAVWRAHGAQRGVDWTGHFCAALKNETGRLTQIVAWLSGGGKADAEAADAWMRFMEAQPGADGFAILGEIFLTHAGLPRKNLAIKKLAQERPDFLAWLTGLQQSYCTADERRRAARAAALAQAALTLIEAVRSDYESAKRRRGALDYDDLIVKTLNLLERDQAAPWVQFKLDGGLDHILIDEAQDTSPEQWGIVKALTEEFFARETRGGAPRTLFAVGDEKQSIFSFQGADPAQFDINRLHFERQVAEAGLPFAEVPLTTSRRSAPEILTFVDRLFESQAARAGLTSRGLAIEHTAHRQTARGGVEFWNVMLADDEAEIDYYSPVDVAQQSSPIVKLAESVANQIQDWIARGRTLPGHDAPIRPGDIMILLPRREPFGGEIIRQLKLRGIAVAGADRIVLAQQIAVMDLAALGHFVLQREDDLNLAALLRSPLCGLGEEDLFQLCQNRAGSLWQSLSARKGELASFEAAHIFLAEMLERADYAPPFEFYTHALTRLNKRRDLLVRLGPEASDAIEEFLSLSLVYEQSQTPSLEGFLDWIARGGNEIKRDMERGRDEVRVMTVHGAKGLEADIVILPDTTGLPEMPWLKGHLLYTGSGVLFPVSGSDEPASVAAAKAAMKEEILGEHRRLLYVALTRARDRLYVCGFQNSRAPRDDTWYRLAEAAAQQLGVPLTRGDITGQSFGYFDDAPEAGNSAPRLGTERTAIPAWASHPAPRETVTPRLIRPSDALDFPEPATLSPLARDDRFKRGNVVHALLARLPDLPPPERPAAALAYAKANGFGQDLANETLAVLNHPDFAAAFSQTSRAEVAFLASLPAFGEGAQVNGRIDRLAVTGEEVLIMDFKTNRPPPAKESDVSPVYLAQMALYRAAAARIFPGRRIVCGLIWTDGPALMRLSDGILDRQLADIQRRLDPEEGHS